MLGFALYEPADPLAAPGVTPPIFGCVPTVGVTFVADSPSEATLTVNAGAIFAAFGGNWDAPFPLGSGPIQGYVLLEGVTIQLGVALADAEEGQKPFGAVTRAHFVADAHDRHHVWEQPCRWRRRACHQPGDVESDSGR